MERERGKKRGEGGEKWRRRREGEKEGSNILRPASNLSKCQSVRLE